MADREGGIDRPFRPDQAEVVGIQPSRALSGRRGRGFSARPMVTPDVSPDSPIAPASTAPESLALFALAARHVAAGFIDKSGRVRALNRAAETLVKSGLRVSNGRLFSEDRQSDAELQRLLGVLSTPAGASLIGASPIVIPRRGQRALIVELLPTARACPEIGPSIAALLVITDLDQQTSASEGLLRSAFGLTIAEGRLAKKLGEGSDLQAACKSLGIGMETARSQLKALFMKTHTNRQSQLIRLFARLHQSLTPR